jgi:cytochrome bd-type quinol oxidase subunit 1
MLIALVAVVHILVSHYAVGGGILLAIENQYALKNGDKRYREYWHLHARFFVLLTVAFGAITGVGIWWTIGLASPLATQTLIRIFVFGWATEWVFFIIEIVAAFAMYYYWNRLPAAAHVKIVWIYAAAAWISLVLITGITAFMLNSAGLIPAFDWHTTGSFWAAFLNLQFIPQTFVRTGGALLLATLYVYLHASITLRKPEDSELLTQVIRRVTRPLLFGLITLAIGSVGWFVFLPENGLLSLQRAAALNVFLGMMAALGGIMVLLILAGPVLFPKSMNVGFAVSLFFIGLMLFSIGEFVREAVRKPYIVDKVILGNQIFPHEVETTQKEGFLNHGRWSNNDAIANVSKLQQGKTIFMYHCNDCHAIKAGYSAVAPLLSGLSREQIKEKVQHLNEPVFNMPPWSGTDQEAESLAEFLITVRPEVKR